LEQAKALARVYESLYLGKPSLTGEEQAALKQLATAIEEKVHNWLSLLTSQAEEWQAGVLEKGFFVRLNTRSPKDARILSPEMFAAIEENKRQLIEEGGIVDENAILRFCYINFVKKMVVHSGKEAVDLLGASHRIWQDIHATVDSIIDKFEMYVVVREWAQIHPSTEFRGFVYERQLNAISSYNRYSMTFT
jgi:hypothetical protein